MSKLNSILNELSLTISKARKLSAVVDFDNDLWRQGFNSYQHQMMLAKMELKKILSDDWKSKIHPDRPKMDCRFDSEFKYAYRFGYYDHGNAKIRSTVPVIHIVNGHFDEVFSYLNEKKHKKVKAIGTKAYYKKTLMKFWKKKRKIKLRSRDEFMAGPSHAVYKMPRYNNGMLVINLHLNPQNEKVWSRYYWGHNRHWIFLRSYRKTYNPRGPYRPL